VWFVKARTMAADHGLGIWFVRTPTMAGPAKTLLLNKLTARYSKTHV
jgi:hypothetical protein